MMAGGSPRLLVGIGGLLLQYFLLVRFLRLIDLALRLNRNRKNRRGSYTLVMAVNWEDGLTK
jgi:hypothetical protein